MIAQNHRRTDFNCERRWPANGFPTVAQRASMNQTPDFYPNPPIQKFRWICLSAWLEIRLITNSYCVLCPALASAHTSISPNMRVRMGGPRNVPALTLSAWNGIYKLGASIRCDSTRLGHPFSNIDVSIVRHMMLWRLILTRGHLSADVLGRQ